MPNMDKDVLKDAIKEGLREWLEEKFAQFGRWTLSGLMAAALAGMVYLALKGQGMK